MRVAIAIVVASVLVGLAGCSGEARPDPDGWYEDWQALVGSVPTVDELGTPPDTNVCNEALGALRVAAEDLVPTPDAATDGPVREWLEIAEGVMFECAPETGSFGSLEEAYAELALLEAEVDASLGR